MKMTDLDLRRTKNKINAGRSEVTIAIRYKTHHMYLISEKEAKFKSMIGQQIFFKLFLKFDKLVPCLNSRGSASQ